MNYWLTTQWPLEKTQSREWALWLPADGRQRAGDALRTGDEVMIYESRSGRLTLDPRTGQPVPRFRGPASIIAGIRLTGPLTERAAARTHNYDDGSQIRWAFRADGRPILRDGFVRRRLVNQTLGYKENYNLHGFGDQHSGLKRLTVAQYRTLLAAYIESGGIQLD